MPMQPPAQQLLNSAQLHFFGTSENRFVIIGFAGSNPVAELVVPVKDAATNLATVGLYFCTQGVASVGLATLAVWQDEKTGGSGSGLWLMTLIEGKGVMTLYSVEQGPGESFQRIVGKIGECCFDKQDLPAFLSFLTDTSGYSESSQCEQVPAWLVPDSATPRIGVLPC